MKHTWNDIPYNPTTERPWDNGDGIARWYRPDGSLEGEISYVDGEAHGIAKWFYQDGSLQYEVPYIFGVRRDTPLSKLEHLVLFGEQRDNG